MAGVHNTPRHKATALFLLKIYLREDTFYSVSSLVLSSILLARFARIFSICYLLLDLLGWDFFNPFSGNQIQHRLEIVSLKCLTINHPCAPLFVPALAKLICNLVYIAPSVV